MNQVQYNALVEKLAGEIVEEAVMEKEAAFNAAKVKEGVKAGVKAVKEHVGAVSGADYRSAKRVAKKSQNPFTREMAQGAAAANKKKMLTAQKPYGLVGAGAAAGFAAGKRKKEASVEEVAFEKAASTYEDAQILKQAAMEVLAEAELYEDAAIEVLAELGYFNEEHLAAEEEVYEDEYADEEYEDEEVYEDEEEYYEE